MNGQEITTRICGGVVAMGLLVGGLWAWNASAAFAVGKSTAVPTMIRFLSAAAIAGAEALVLAFVASAVFRPGRVDAGVRVALSATCAIAVIGAFVAGVVAVR